MEATLLGTGATYSEYNCASTIIDKKILVDLGPGIIKQILKLKYSLQNIEAILITHLHFDHILDFPTFMANIKILNLKHKIKIIGPQGTKEKLSQLLKLLDEDELIKYMNKWLDFIEIKEDLKIINVNENKIEIEKVLHSGIEAYGYIINNKLGITGDCIVCDGTKNIIRKSEMIIADCSVVNGDINHMGYDNIQEILNENPNKKIIATHLRDETRKELENKNLENFIMEKDTYTFKI